uniref:Dihydrolipoamide acetyltransferase component of pyruvate dehydrogenase complex n=1 Tax=Glossina austeni TaxID=7395 RepID=A0A1A9VJG5_GLOAU
MFRLRLLTLRHLSRKMLSMRTQTVHRQEGNARALLLQYSKWIATSPVNNNARFLVIHGKQCIYTSAGRWQRQTVNVPPFPESVAEGEAKVSVQVGQQVSVDQVIIEVETDKTAVPIPAPCNGIIRELLVKDGDIVRPGQPVFVIEQTAAGAAPAPKPATTAAPSQSPPTPAVAAAKPAVAEAKPAVATTKPAVATAKPAVAAAPRAPAAPSPPKPPVAAKAPPPPVTPDPTIPKTTLPPPEGMTQLQVKIPPAQYSREITGTRTEQRVKMNRMRQRIALRLKESQNTNAMLTTFNEIDMSAAMEFRKTNLDAFTKKYGIKLGYVSIFCKASSYALQDQPVVNAVIEDNVCLMVPVIRNVECKNFAEIEIDLAALANKARKNLISVEDMAGGTFTVSNGGVYGSLISTPIINPPQSAILGMHGVFERPIAIKGKVVIRPMMYVALSYDHRLIDGREAIMFLRKIKSAVEDPKIMLAGL